MTVFVWLGSPNRRYTWMPPAGQKRIGLRQPSASAGAPMLTLPAGWSSNAFWGKALRLLLFLGRRMSRKTTAPFWPIAFVRLPPLGPTSLRFKTGLVVSMKFGCVATQTTFPTGGELLGLFGSTIVRLPRDPPCSYSASMAWALSRVVWVARSDAILSRPR